jgi:hypothetical protein
MYCKIQFTPKIWESRNAMVINYPSRIDGPLEVLIALALIQLELQGFHAMIIYDLDRLVS